MKARTKVVIAIILILSITACSIFTPNKKTSPANTPVIDSNMAIITTNNPNYGIVITNKNGEALILATETGSDSKVSNIKSATWISPDKKSITVFLDKGLPTHAVADGNLVIFEYSNDSSVNVTIIAPDGSKSNQSNVPIKIQQIPIIDAASKQDSGSPKLALIAMKNNEMTPKEWGRFASIAFGVFSCTATIASGGTLSILFGVGCAATIYTIWATSQEEEIPVLDSATTGVSVGQCAIGMAQKDPISVADCASSIIDIGSKISDEANEVVTENKSNISLDQDQILGKWSGEAGWVCDTPPWQTIFEFFPDKVTASFNRDGETETYEVNWSLLDNNIKIQFPETLYVGIISGEKIVGTMEDPDSDCDGNWTITKNR